MLCFSRKCKEAVVHRRSWKFHRKAPVLEALFNKVAGLVACNFIKKRLQNRCFSAKSAKFLRAAFWQYEYEYYSLIKSSQLQPITAQKMKFFIKVFFSKCAQIRSFLRIWSHLLKKSLMENFIFCAVYYCCSWFRLSTKFNSGNKSTLMKVHQKKSFTMFLKISVLKNFTNFTGKHLYSSLFLIKL